MDDDSWKYKLSLAAMWLKWSNNWFNKSSFQILGNQIAIKENHVLNVLCIFFKSYVLNCKKIISWTFLILVLIQYSYAPYQYSTQNNKFLININNINCLSALHCAFYLCFDVCSHSLCTLVSDRLLIWMIQGFKKRPISCIKIIYY